MISYYKGKDRVTDFKKFDSFIPLWIPRSPGGWSAVFICETTALLWHGVNYELS